MENTILDTKPKFLDFLLLFLYLWSFLFYLVSY